MQRGATPRLPFIYHLSYVHGLVLAGPWALSKPRYLVSSFSNSSSRLLLWASGAQQLSEADACGSSFLVSASNNNSRTYLTGSQPGEDTAASGSRFSFINKAFVYRWLPVSWDPDFSTRISWSPAVKKINFLLDFYPIRSYVYVYDYNIYNSTISPDPFWVRSGVI